MRISRSPSTHGRDKLLLHMQQKMVEGAYFLPSDRVSRQWQTEPASFFPGVWEMVSTALAPLFTNH